MIEISSCICTYNRYDLLPTAVESLINQKTDKKYEILIIDNSPINEQVEILRGKYKDHKIIKYIWLDEPGLSNARNHGVCIAQGEIICYMDDDAIASEIWLQNLHNAFYELGSEIVCVGGKVEPIWEIPRPDWLHDWLKGYVSIVDWGDGEKPRVAKDGEWMAGTNISFRTEFLKKNGLFDKRLGRNGDGSILLSNEEIKIAEAIKERGFKTAYSEKALVKHLVPKERLTKEWFRKRVFWQVISDFISNKNVLLNNLTNIEKYGIEYLYKLEPRDRNVFGLFKNTNDEYEFFGQLKAIEAIVGNLLCEKYWERK